MVRGRNGYVTVSVGVDGAQKKLSASARQSTEARNRRAIRLRTEGWSYRHISVALNMSYASVCNLLDGEEARLPPAPLPFHLQTGISAAHRAPAQTAGLPRNARSDTRLDALTAQIAALQTRVDLVVAMQNGMRKRLSQLEDKILSAMKEEHRALGRHLHAGMKTLLSRVLPQPEHKTTE